MAARIARRRKKKALRHSPIAARGIARREISECQRTNRLSPTRIRFAASKENFASETATVKLQRVEGQLGCGENSICAHIVLAQIQITELIPMENLKRHLDAAADPKFLVAVVAVKNCARIKAIFYAPFWGCVTETGFDGIVDFAQFGK